MSGGSCIIKQIVALFNKFFIFLGRNLRPIFFTKYSFFTEEKQNIMAMPQTFFINPMTYMRRIAIFPQNTLILLHLTQVIETFQRGEFVPYMTK